MRKAMLFACVLGLGISTQSLAGALENAEAGIKELFKVLEEAIEVLKTMKDETTVKAGEPKLKKLNDRARKLFKQMHAAIARESLSKDEIAQLKMKYAKTAEALHETIRAEEKRVAELPGGRDILKLLRRGPLEGKPPEKEKEENDK